MVLLRGHGTVWPLFREPYAVRGRASTGFLRWNFFVRSRHARRQWRIARLQRLVITFQRDVASPRSSMTTLQDAVTTRSRTIMSWQWPVTSPQRAVARLGMPLQGNN